jgi:hypothetical protein
MVPSHKGVAFLWKALLQTKFLVPGEIPMARARIGPLETCSRDGRRMGQRESVRDFAVQCPRGWRAIRGWIGRLFI